MRSEMILFESRREPEQGKKWETGREKKKGTDEKKDPSTKNNFCINNCSFFWFVLKSFFMSSYQQQLFCS